MAGKKMNIMRASSPWKTALIGFCVSVSFGCSGTSGASDSARSGFFNADLGLATAFDLRDKTRRILDKYQFVVIRFEQDADMIYYESQWKNRYPFQDELDLGIDEARTRIMIQGKPRTRRGNQGDIMSVRFNAENQVRLKDSAEWHYNAISHMARTYLKQFAEDLETEYRSGMRRF